jgi:hypothetical protein
MALGAGLALVVTSRVGATHDGSGALHACVNRYTGALRYVTDPARCSPGEFPITLAGGDAIPAAPVYTVRTERIDVSGGITTFGGATVECEAGETAIDGGSRFTNGAGSFIGFGGFSNPASAPAGSPPTAWWTNFDLSSPYNGDEPDPFIENWVLCVS